MHLRILLATAIAFSLAISNADAQVRNTVSHQHSRISQGVRSGKLTRSETRNLVNDQQGIRQEVRSAKSDGVVTRCEKQDIRQDQRQVSRSIFRKKLNRRDRV